MDGLSCNNYILRVKVSKKRTVVVAWEGKGGEGKVGRKGEEGVTGE